METQILNLQAPCEYIHCNGEVGKHIATLIVYEAMKGEDGSYKLESHSHPIVKYWNAPGGVVWNQAELTDCDVVCDENSLGVDSHSFFRMVRKKWGIENDTDYREKAKQLRETLIDYDIMISDEELLAKYKNMIIHEWNHNIMLIFEKKEGKIVCSDNGKSQFPIYCEAATEDELVDELSDQCYDWERFTDRRVNIHFETEQEEYKDVIERIEIERPTWDL